MFTFAGTFKTAFRGFDLLFNFSRSKTFSFGISKQGFMDLLIN
jgi:hypothetical protein